MSKAPLLIRLFICIVALGLCVYSYLDMQNKLTDMRIRLPLLAKEVKRIQGENSRLQYEIDEFENPSHLMDLARKSEFSHLKQPLMNDVIIVKQLPMAVDNLQEKKVLEAPGFEGAQPKLKIAFAVGVKP